METTVVAATTITMDAAANTEQSVEERFKEAAKTIVNNPDITADQMYRDLYALIAIYYCFA